MKYFVTLVCAAVVSLFATCCSPARSPFQTSVDDLKSKTVALVHASTNDDGGGVSAHCTGVWVSKHTILTARHCVDELERGDDVAYATEDDIFAAGSVMSRGTVAPHKASLYAFDDDHDLALLHDDSPPEHATAGVNEMPRAGDLARTMGHSLGLWWTYSSGEVTAVRYMAIGGARALWVQADAPISPGNSGGALFDAAGNVIGVCHGVMVRGQLLNFYIHPSYVRVLLDAQGAML